MEVTQLIINGTTKFSTMVARLIEMEGEAKVIAFTTAKQFINDKMLEGKPVVPFEELTERFDNRKVRILNTIGYSKMNTVRERVNQEIEESGFTQYSYISKHAFVAEQPRLSSLLTAGCIIMPNAFIGTEVKIGKSTVIYSNCSLTHDIVIEDNVFIGSGCVVGGNVIIGRNSFIGMNSTIKNRINLAPFSLVGCGSNVLKTIEQERRVIVGNPAKVLEGKDSMNSL